MVFKTQIKIHFDEADPAGIAFAGNLFTKMHRCFEDFLDKYGTLSFFIEGAYAFPLRHIEAEYFRSLEALKTYDVAIWVQHIGASSFQMLFEVNDSTQLCARLNATHVCCQKSDFKKSPLPQDLTDYLKNYLKP